MIMPGSLFCGFLPETGDFPPLCHGTCISGEPGRDIGTVRNIGNPGSFTMDASIYENSQNLYPAAFSILC